MTQWDTKQNQYHPCFFFSNQNDLFLKQTPTPVFFLISKEIIHHFKSQRENQLRQKKSSDFFQQSLENRSIMDT